MKHKVALVAVLVVAALGLCGCSCELVIRTQSLPDGAVGAEYFYPFRADCASGSLVGDPLWGIAGGTLPPGLSLSTDGDLSGSPTLAGRFEFTVEVLAETGSRLVRTSKGFTLTIGEG